MKKLDIATLQQLMALKLQSATAAYHKACTHQMELRNTAQRLLNESNNISNDVKTTDCADLLAQDRFRQRLKKHAQELLSDARRLEAPISAARASTQHALSRKSAVDSLGDEAKKSARQHANNRDEERRDQHVLRDY